MGLLERREKEKDSRRKLILKSARTLFFARGFKNVTVERIAKISELGKGSIYLYFSSKEDIYAQILLTDIEKFHQQVFALFNKKKTATELLSEFSHFYADFFINDPELFRILMTYMLHTDQMKLSDEQNKRVVISMGKTMDIISNIFQLGIDTNEFHAGINLKHNQLAIWGMLNGIISLHIFSGKENKRKERIHTTVESTLEIYIKGLKQG
jgi:AcrR family transcriptional regulator